MPNLGAPEIIIIALVIILLFGFKKLPDAARSLGRSARVFKAEVNEMKNEDEQRKAGQTGTSPVNDQITPQANGNAVQENAPRTDNPSGPVA